MKEQIKELRVKIDGLAQLTKELKPFWNLSKSELELLDVTKNFQPKEINKSVDSLYLAKAWLGKVLGELGEETPYANDGSRKTVEDIEPTVDVNKEVEIGNAYWETLSGWGDKSYVEKVDWLRQEITNVFETWRTFSLMGMQMTQILSFEQHIQEARFWLGFELQRIKENN